MSELTLKDFMPGTETGNVSLLLNEVRHALERLSATGETTIIDLRRIPLTEDEEATFQTLLGQGEVSAQIDASGPTDVVETAYSGVWLVTHRTTEDTIIGRYVEITTIPEIMLSQQPDIDIGLRRLQEKLEELRNEEAIEC